MPLINSYEIGYSEQFSIAGRQEITEDLNLATNPIAESGTLSGTITSAGNGPVAGATVKLFNANNEPFEHTTTDATGNYIFENVPTGSYNVVATANGFLLSNAVPVTIQNNQVRDLDFTLVPDPNADRSTIFGIISSNLNNAPIENVIVTLTLVTPGPDPDEVIGSVTTNDRGQYFFANLETGNYIVSATSPGFSPNQTGSIPVGTNQFLPGDIVLESNTQTNTGTVSGFIFDEVTDLPIANATVALYSITGGVERIIDITQTSNSGRYLFANVAPGNYRVKATVQTQG